ncbi:uncharacterized protein LOC125810029 isoform X2 [Solanum verrucosum]|uniref:uncharacterized protein LOC125810029 isoform X2 n=1 Tax=Solanum verrucosum TaxID=315347 RepID=UPI0020CFFB83|nr:uncharacterized protein LOC125810029 isoform X2 [Solanum verrucosum]
MEIWNFPACSFFSDHHTHTIMPSLLSGRILHFPKLSATSSSESYSSKQVKFPKKISQNSATSVRPADSGSPLRKTHKLNLEVSPHRAVSAVRLMRIEFGGAFADLLNEQGKGSGDNEMGYVERTLGFRTRDLDDRDLRLVTEVVGGTIRWRRYLDHLILSLCHDERTFRSMEPLLVQILRIGFYEITKLDMPPYAVVDESVRLAKVALRPGAGNLVNGILRKLAVLKWMVRRWTKYFGQDTAIKLMTWNNSYPSFSLRANTGKGLTGADLVSRLKMLKVPHEPSLYLDDFVRLKTGMQNVIQAGLLKEGFCAVQDESAGLVVSIVDPQPGENIIDCCAAPGGKTLFMASRLNGQGKLFAVDINEGRLRILRETAKLHQVIDVISTIHSDLRTFSTDKVVEWDKVLLDAPCSGLGVLSKRADLRWNRRLEDMEQLKHLQDELLDSASRLVKPGGVLIYSTCSIDPEENEERIEAFLLRHPEFYIDPVNKYVPENFVTNRGFYMSNPVKHELDGAFAARLVRSQ